MKSLISYGNIKAYSFRFDYCMKKTEILHHFTLLFIGKQIAALIRKHAKILRRMINLTELCQISIRPYRNVYASIMLMGS